MTNLYYKKVIKTTKQGNSLVNKNNQKRRFVMKDTTTIQEIFSFYSRHREDCNNYYSIANDRNIDRIYETFLMANDINTLFVKSSIVILTANKYERNILHQNVFMINKQKIKRFTIDLHTAGSLNSSAYAYCFELNGYIVLHIHANVTGANTIGGAADIIRWIDSNEYLYPSAIISFGICYGVNQSKEQLGDVVLSRKIYPYFIGVKINGEELKVSDDNSLMINDKLNLALNNLCVNNKFLGLDFKVFFKNYITGEAVVSSKKWRRKFTEITTQEIYAGDMEGYGLFKECNSSKKSIPCFILKSICDWGENKNFDTKEEDLFNLFIKVTQMKRNGHEILASLKDRLQAYACNCAFEILNIIVQNNILEKSLFSYLQIIIKDFNGKASTCVNLHQYLNATSFVKEKGYMVSKKYIHHSLMILDEKQSVICSAKCKSDNNSSDDCIAINQNTSITIVKSKEL